MIWTTDLFDYEPTQHAQKRMAQRNITLADIHFVFEHGQRFHRAGAIFFFLRGRDIPKEVRTELGRLEGTTVVLSREKPRIITVYRNRQGLRQLKRKIERDNRSEQVH